MITIKLTFFAILQTEFGEEQKISVEEPIKLMDLFNLFQSKNGEKGNSIFLENEELKNGFTILIDGRNIHALEGLNTVLEKKSELSFFPLLAGGFFKTK